tara:strand:+ start:44074 stop:45138 length:1065 start_codon:yes stop_codon:yes gene_type:complete
MKISESIKLIKQKIRDQAEYNVTIPKHNIKLNQNESPYDWSNDLKLKILSKLEKTPWNRYPDLKANNLMEKIAQILNCSSNQIVLGKGSNEVIQSIITSIISTNDKVCVLNPTFPIYKMITNQNDGIIIESKLDEEFKINEKDLLEKALQSKITILCNPNSPTGSLISLDIIEKILKSIKGFLVVDEAYVDFSKSTCLSLLSKNSNLIVTRTFSKAFGLAAFRLGYAVMHSKVAAEIQKCMLPFNIDKPSIIAGNIILSDYKKIIEYSDKIINERENLIFRINQLDDLKAFKSRANFFLLESKISPQKLFNKLLINGILVRDVSNYYLCKNKIRISIGSQDENEVLFNILSNVT